MIRLAALLCGILCGAGVILSGLFQPDLLRGFVGPEQAWDMSLGLGLLSALCVAAVILALTRRLSRPLLGAAAEPVEKMLTGRTVAGGVLFGLGWGLSGYFPLAALVAFGFFAPGAVIFLTSVLVGMILCDLVESGGWPGIKGLRSRG